jgi:hypothetical protein
MQAGGIMNATMSMSMFMSMMIMKKTRMSTMARRRGGTVARAWQVLGHLVLSQVRGNQQCEHGIPYSQQLSPKTYSTAR